MKWKKNRFLKPLNSQFPISKCDWKIPNWSHMLTNVSRMSMWILTHFFHVIYKKIIHSIQKGSFVNTKKKLFFISNLIVISVFVYFYFIGLIYLCNWYNVYGAQHAVPWSGFPLNANICFCVHIGLQPWLRFHLKFYNKTLFIFLISSKKVMWTFGRWCWNSSLYIDWYLYTSIW